MRKVCVFVEGQTEQVFVREFLVKWYEYSGISIECLQIRGNQSMQAEYPVPAPDAEIYYQIVNVGNDNRVLSFLLDRVSGLKAEGFEIVLGLRDMYCATYRNRSKVIDSELNNSFIAASKEEIDERLKEDSGLVSFHYAIMEVEAWMLAMYPFLLKKFPSITMDDINNVFDTSADVETSVYHPADTLDRIYGLSGNKYDKHKSDANSILSYLEKDDFERLYESGNCASFRKFADALLLKL